MASVRQGFGLLSYFRQGLPALTKQQKIFYEENGYVVVEKNVSSELLDEMAQRFVDICNGTVTNHGVLLIMKDPSLRDTGVKGEYLINKIQDFSYDPILWKYISHKNIVDVVEQLIGPEITAIHSMLINKPPNADAGSSLHPLHQDLHYFPYRPPEKIVASWTAMERVDENNGCLYVVPGSHRGPLHRHSYPEGFKKNLYHEVKGLKDVKKEYVVMKKGDSVFFHPLLLHGSGPNKTSGFRKAISCHYANSNCDVVDIRGSTQESLAREIEATMQRVGVRGVDFQEIWRLKSRLVKGNPGRIQNIPSRL